MHQPLLQVLSAQKCSCLSRCVRTRIVVVKSDPFSAVGFPDFLEGNWKTIGCVPLRIDCWRCSSGTIETCPVFPKKQVIICLEVHRARATFVGFGSSGNTHTVDCCLLSGSYALIHDLSTVTMS